MAEYTLPELDYDYGALEPHISGQINEIHHSKHHAAYVKGVNDAVAKLEEARAGDDSLLARLGGVTRFWRRTTGVPAPIVATVTG